MKEVLVLEVSSTFFGIHGVCKLDIECMLDFSLVGEKLLEELVWGKVVALSSINYFP